MTDIEKVVTRTRNIEKLLRLQASDLSGSKTPGRKGSLAALEAFCLGSDDFFEFGTSKYSFEVLYYGFA